MIDLKAQARTIYFEARRRQATHLKALTIIPVMLEHQLARIRSDHEHGVQVPEEDLGAVLPTLPEIEAWAGADAWSLQYEQLQSSDFRDNLRAPEDEEDRFRLRLEAATRNREVAGDALRLVQEDMDKPDFVISDAFFQRMRAAQSLYNQALTSESKAEDDARKRLLEIPSGPAAAADIEARKQKLLKEYGGKGEQYEILCSQLAGLDFRAEAARTSGRDIPITELVSLNDSIIRTVGQLQKYTESTKSESLSKDRTELGIAIMTIVERIVAPTQPNLWAQAFAEIKQHLQVADRLPDNVLRLVPRADGSFGVGGD